MKNLKTLLVTGGLMGVMMIGATTAKAGIIIIGGKAPQETTQATRQCTETSFLGIIVSDLKALITGDTTNNGCTSASFAGLIVTD